MNYQSKPSMVSRSGWGASSHSCSTRLSTINNLVIHHCATSNNSVDNRTEIQQQKYIQNLHQLDNGWCDMGYHYGIGKNGGILEGRLEHLMGAHVGGAGRNHDTLGVVVHGDYRSRTFTGTQRNALVRLLAWLCYKYNLSPSKITYHQALDSTACPGTNIINQISTIRSEVHDRLYGPGPITG
ncbi:N-acetylmuramoyl-L-alanine amidase [Bacillaceae bacterium W0354]